MSGVRPTERISVVGGGENALGISHPLDPNVYLLSGGNELALIDAGVGLDEAEILANVRSLGFQTEAIRHILLTHAHADHSGGAAALAQMLDACVYLSEIESPALEAGDEDALGLTIARRNGFYPENYRLRPCTVQEQVHAGQQIRCGDLEVSVLATPGHSAGSVCYLVETDHGRALFTGDTVFAGGKISLLVCPGSDLLALATSINNLAGLEVTSLLPGHGLFALRRGQDHIDQAVRAFNSMVPPRSILQ